MLRRSSFYSLAFVGLFIFPALGLASPATQQNAPHDSRKEEDVSRPIKPPYFSGVIDLKPFKVKDEITLCLVLKEDGTGNTYRIRTYADAECKEAIKNCKVGEKCVIKGVAGSEGDKPHIFAEEFTAFSQDRKDIASPSGEVRKTKTGKEFRRVSEEELRKQGLKDEGVTACVGEHGQDGAWQEPDYQNAKGEMVKGKIWCGAIGRKDGKETMTQQDAKRYCEDRGLELPTGYPDYLNGKNEFPNEDSDHIRLTRSMGAKDYRGEGYSHYAQGSSSQTVLPNLLKVDGSTRWFWSSSVRPFYSYLAYAFLGRNGYIDYDSRSYADLYSVRCVVARR